MNDSERIYALYVQANPVPHPESLPVTQAEAELLTFERSTDMDTKERIEVRPAPEVAPRRRNLAIGLAAVLVVAAVAVGAFLIPGDSDSPVAAADAFPEVVFDGNTCQYNGPTVFEEGTARVTFVNTTAAGAEIAGFRIPSVRLDDVLADPPLGTDMALGEFDPMPGPSPFILGASAGSEPRAFWQMRAGTHIVDCLVYGGGDSFEAGTGSTYPTHMWRAQTTIEVVAP